MRTLHIKNSLKMDRNSQKLTLCSGQLSQPSHQQIVNNGCENSAKSHKGRGGGLSSL